MMRRLDLSLDNLPPEVQAKVSAFYFLSYESTVSNAKGEYILTMISAGFLETAVPDPCAS